MISQSNKKSFFSLEAMPGTLAALVAVVGVVALTGWWLDYAAMKSVIPGWVSMTVNTAIGFILAGVSLGLLCGNSREPWRQWAARVLAAFVALIGLLTLAEYLFGWDLGIDELFLRLSARTGATFRSGRMAPNTAFNFLIAGFALLLCDVKNSSARRFVEIFSLLVALVGFLAIVGYAYGVADLYAIASYTQMALLTAVLFLVLSVAIPWARPSAGLVALGSRFASSMPFRFTAFVVLAILLTGSLVSTLMIRRSQIALRQEIITNNLAAAELVADFAAQYVDGATTTLNILASSPQIVEIVASGNFNQTTVPLQLFLKSNKRLDGSSLIDLNGITRATGNIPLRGVGNSVRDRDWFQQAIATGKPYLGFPVISRGTGRPAIPYSVPIIDKQGEVRGVLVGGISLAALADAITKFGAGPSSRTWLTDLRQGGVILAHRDRKRILAPASGRNEAVRRMLKGERGAIASTDSQGITNLAAFAPVPNMPWGVLILQPSEAAFAPVAASARQSMLLIAILLLPAAGISSWLTLQVTRPLVRLREAATTVGSGDFRGRIEVTSRDEIGQVAAAFNRMAEALSGKDLELRKRNDELQETNRELDAFSHSVSHDLRAPLRHITGFGNILKQHASANLDDKSHHYLEMILDSSSHMGTLVDDLLAFSRMGRVEMRSTHVNLEQLVKEALHDLRAELAGRAIVWQIEPLPEVQGDPSMLRLVLINLISNAVKFTGTRQEAKIEIGSVSGERDEWVLFVRDNGVGVDIQHANKR